MIKPLSVGVISLGCNKNRVDTETALGLLQEAGYVFTGDPAQADILMVNTCGFIESAKEESIDAIFEMAEYKKPANSKSFLSPAVFPKGTRMYFLRRFPRWTASWAYRITQEPWKC